MKLILEKANQHFRLRLPFVLYKNADDNLIKGIFQKSDTLFMVNDFTENGFVFASFDGNKTYIIPENESEISSEIFIEHQSISLAGINFYSNEQERSTFENLVDKGIEAIKNQEFKKVVLSRKESVEISNFDLMLTFEKLVQLYPTAFIYCFYHPKVGVWLGASPEQLLKTNQEVFQTISLAGTQKDSGNSEVIWKQKEEEEQQFVTDYIANKLKDAATELKISEPYSSKAGSLWHIKTDISGVLNPNYGLQKVIRLLHPTPAVCGFPKDQSKKFILENENYDRTFYTGFLGELNCENANGVVSSDLFVNLRCMELEYDLEPKESKSVFSKAIIYIGCGITKDSLPEKEWQESVNKSMTMKKVLDLGVEFISKSETFNFKPETKII